MKYLLMGAAAIALLTACGKKDDVVDADVAEISETVKPGKIKLRAGDAATAEEALTALSLDQEDGGFLTTGSRKLKGDTASFSDVKLSGPDGETGVLSIDKLEISGLGMIEGAPNFSRLLLSDISLPVQSDDNPVTGGIESIELVNPSPALAAWIGELVEDGEPGKLAPEDISFDQLSVGNLNFVIDENGEEGTFSFDAIDLFGASKDEIGSLSINKFAMNMVDPSSDTDVNASVKSFKMTGLDLSLMSQYVLGGADMSNPTELLTGMTSGARSADPANPGYGMISLDDLDVTVSGASIVMPKFSSSVKKDKKGRTTKVTVAPYKLSLSAGEGELGEKLAAGLASLGYETVELQGQSEQKYDPETDVMTMTEGKNYYELADGFRLDFSGKYEGTKAIATLIEESGGDDAAAEALLENLDAIVLHNFSIALDDNGIVDRAFSAYAAQSGQDPEDVRAQVSGMMAMAPMMAGGSGIDPALINEAASALSSFITDPKTLTLSFDPKEPLSAASFEGLEDPSALTKEVLGFSASNE